MKILFGFFVGLFSLAIVFYLFYPKIKNASQIDVLNIQPSPTLIPFSLKDAPTESLKGNLTILSDDVSWQDRVATKASKISQNITIQQGEHIETSKKGRAKIVFPDVLQINISEETLMNIIQTLPTNLVFSLNKGGLNLKKIGSNTISVRSKHLLANIDGEVVIVVDNEKPIITLSVISGTITLAYNNLNYKTQSLIVKQGQTVVFNDSTRKVVSK